jgi:acyl-coenzyme A thioesterase PaaI-like protein
MPDPSEPSEPSLQERFAPRNQCFGCGPANEKGLRIRSFARGEEYVATFRAEAHHQAFPGVLNGGICGALLDCHSNWAACATMMKATGAQSPPCTVTADFAVTLKRPTPMDAEITVTARVLELSGDKKRALVEAKLECKGKVTATCKGTFVAVEEGHPAYHRW